MPRIPTIFCLVATSLIFLTGCRSQHSCADFVDEPETAADIAIASGLQPPQANLDVQAMAVPPRGWKPDPLKASDRHKHQVWISPTGDTAYGIIHFTLPLPVGPDLALWGFIQQMKQIDAPATLLSKESDDRLPGLRFVAEGARYTIRTNLIVKRFDGWAIYAGSLTARPVNESEMIYAIRAREQTRVGLP